MIQSVIAAIIILDVGNSGSTCISSSSSSSANDEKVTKTTWAECVNMYDVFTCAELKDILYKQSGKTFNHTKPNAREIVRGHDLDTIINALMTTKRNMI